MTAVLAVLCSPLIAGPAAFLALFGIVGKIRGDQ